MRIPEELARQVEVFHGEAGRAWIADLPRILAELEGRWSLTLHEPFPGIWYNVVAPATRYGTVPVVLKVGFPREELFTELDALRLYGGHGAVKLLEADELLGALLLERVRPGRELVELEDDDRTTRIAAGVMRAIQRPPPLDHRFPTVDRWATRGMQNLRTTFDGGTGPFPRRLVEQAESIFADLLPTQEGRVVLHGDLHHWNILSSERAPWLAIDPKGVVGEPAYETGAWLRNPNTTLLSKPDVAGTLARRIAILSEELGVECERIRYWGIAQAVLSAWWSYEDATGGEQFGVRVAEILAGL